MTRSKGHLIGTVVFASSLMMDTSVPAAQAMPPSPFIGTWTVAGVEVSGVGVQALAHDDPAYMGKRLVLGKARFAWLDPASAGASIGDRCGGPQVRRVTMPPGAADDRIADLPVRPIAAFDVSCASGSWGPNGTGGPRLYRLFDGRIALDWYDGGLLLLGKDPGPARGP